MKPENLPSTVEELQALLLQTSDELLQTKKDAQRQLKLAEQKVAQLSATVSEQSRKLQQQEQTILDLLAALRGKQRERIDPGQLLLFDLGELETFLEEEQEAKSSSRRKRKGHGRRLLPDHLPQEEVLHELPEPERHCPHDGQVMQPIRYEISKQLEYQPAVLKVLVHKRAVYACPDKHDEATLVTAPKPPQPIDKGLPGPGLIAALTLGKFGDHLPGYRLEDILTRHGVEIRRSTVYDWLAAAADLARPLVELMKQRVLESKVIHTDDTQVKLIDLTIRGTRLARFWAYVGDRGHPYIVYDFTETRERKGPQRFLQNFQGYLQADAYGGYDGIYLQSGGRIVEVACWAHCRRYWWKAREQDPPRAHHALAVIGRLYDIERATKEMTPEQRQSLRAEHAAPLLTDLKAWLDDQVLLPKSRIGQAATYTRNQWTALNRYLEDGDLSIDNNISERCVKPVAIGRKNWLFIGSAPAGRRAAILMSLVASCKDNRVEPWAYLRDLFTRLPQNPDLQSLLPDRWLKEHPQHRWTIADRRQNERAAKGRL
jgi:transposase